MKLLLEFSPAPVVPSTVTTRKDVKGFAINDDYHLYFRDRQQVLKTDSPLEKKLDENMFDHRRDSRKVLKPGDSDQERGTI